MPCEDSPTEKWFYQSLFDLWFPETQQFVSNPQARDTIKKTFFKGGYYLYDFPGSDLTLISLNSLLFIKKNKCNHKGAVQQLDWLQEVFKENESGPGQKPRRQFILSMHEFHGVNYFNEKFQNFWIEKFGNRYVQMLSEN